MDKKLLSKLLKITKLHMQKKDPAHDMSHILRVLANARKILKEEKGDASIVIPAVLFHDLITYPKTDPKNKDSVKESAEEAGNILLENSNYSKEKIEQVKKCILCTSFSFGEMPQTIEERITVDSDLLEATGAISIMRTFSYGGEIMRPFYNTNDPFAQKRNPDDASYSLDLFFTRLLKVDEKLFTKTAKKIAKERSDFLRSFLTELKKELE